MKEAAFKGLVQPILEYDSSVWESHNACLIDESEKQKHAARLVTRNYTYEKGSMTDILKNRKRIPAEIGRIIELYCFTTV